MLDVEHGVNVKGGTVLLNNALVADDVAKEDRIRRDRSMSVVSALFCRKAIQLFCFVGLLVWSDVALAQAKGSISLIRDAEIEATLRQISNPILEAAGITADSVDLYIVRDKRLNAFVAGGQNLFLNTGLLQRTEHAGQLAGVIAHEVGHIAGGHLSRVGTAQSRATAEVILATVLGAAAAVAGNPVLGTAIITGGHTFAQGEFLSFSRSQEQQADQAAISYLNRLDLSSRGLAEFFHVLDEQNLLTTTRDNPYLRSHPLTRDRIRTVEAKVEDQRQDLPDFPETWDLGHQRMVVKLKAFLDDPRRTLNAFQGDALTDRYARAIANYRLPDLEAAVAEIDGLIEDYPEDPYFHELKGQML
ncbi:MAG: M48 family metallopeptidase, partial [Geminicoccaceae bacterium]